MIINCDGGARGNPGPAGIGVVIWDDNHELLGTYREYIGETTNNVAEYKSLVKALEMALKYGDSVEVFMDSELVIRQVTGEYKVKAEHLRPLFQKVKELEKKFKRITYSSVPRDEHYQQEADRQVNLALDEH